MVNLKDIKLPGSKITSINDFFRIGTDWFLMICGGLAVLAIVYSGIMYITAGGDTAKAESARKNLTWAIIGLVIILLAEVIIQLVKSILAANFK